jgi:hypothetical protein
MFGLHAGKQPMRAPHFVSVTRTQLVKATPIKRSYTPFFTCLQQESALSERQICFRTLPYELLQDEV